jgi:hypothetical protein
MWHVPRQLKRNFIILEILFLAFEETFLCQKTKKQFWLKAFLQHIKQEPNKI